MSWKVKYINYPAQYAKLREEILEKIDSTLQAGDVMMRHQLDEFEAHLAEFVSTKFALGLNSGTDALQLALKAAGVSTGDEVITVSHTMGATVAAIIHNNSVPVLVDIQDDHNMDPNRIESALTPKSKAIIPVHLNGRICDMDTIMEISDKANLIVIEDAAQALGASFNNRPAGYFGHAGCFSFYPAKILGTYGDAGGLVTNSENLYQKVKLLRNHGISEKGEIELWGYNTRLDNLHAVILDLKLSLVRQWVDQRRSIAAKYTALLGACSSVKLPPEPITEGPYFDAFQNYEIEAVNRDGLVNFLQKQGVEVLIPWKGKAVHQFESLGLSHYSRYLPKTNELFQNVLMIPMHCELSDSDVEYVADTIKAFYKSN